jgi:hypothetical protein
VSSGIRRHIMDTGIGCFFAHHAGKDFYFCFDSSYFSKFPPFFSIFFCSWSADHGTSEFFSTNFVDFSTQKFANISEKYGELRLV